MPQRRPMLLALDFDGVVCDGLIEYFQTAWKAYRQIWAPANPTPPEDLAPRFYKLRPVVETGWEMPVLLRALRLGHSDDEILQDWARVKQSILDAENLDLSAIAHQVDGVRDRWIEQDLDDWLAQHRFYPGMIERLQQLLNSPIPMAIVTTKEGRFVQQLLKQQQVPIATAQIFGKEVRQPKAQTLLDLMRSHHLEHASQIWFVEDRLKTLQGVNQQADLSGIGLFLADWGYNTAGDRQTAQADPNLHLLSLEQFAQDFAAWM